MRELELTSDQKKLAAKDVQRRTERQQRDAFRKLLMTMHHDGRLGPRTKWKDVLPDLLQTDEYRGAAAQSGSTPAELFEDVVESLNAEYTAHRKRIRACLAAASYEVVESTTSEQMDAAIAAGVAAVRRSRPSEPAPETRARRVAAAAPRSCTALLKSSRPSHAHSRAVCAWARAVRRRVERAAARLRGRRRRI
jgi:hypothetical protein